jgi:hypothetical protein
MEGEKERKAAAFDDTSVQISITLSAVLEF